MYPTVIVLCALLAIWANAWNSSKPESHRIVDLTHVFDNTTLNFPGARAFEMRKILLELSGVRIQVEEHSSNTHVGTHMDAPCVFFPGRYSVTEIPLDRLIAPAAVVDISDKAAFNRDYQLQIDDLLQWEDTTGILLNDVILLVRSGWARYWSCNATAYFGNADSDPNNLHYPGIASSAALWLVKNRNVYGVGVETLSLDYGPARGFPSGNIFYKNNIYALENMDDMSDLPLFGATLHAMPMKIGDGACGAPTRIVAIVPEKFDFDYRSGHSEDMNLLKRKSPTAK